MSTETPATPVGGVDVAGDFCLSLLVLMRAYRTVVASALDDVPKGARAYQTLAVVARGDQQNQLALATYLAIDRTLMTHLIDDLVTAGFVERRLDPADRRQRKIVATARGVNTLQDLQRQVREAEDQLLEALDEDERQTFQTLLSRVACGVRSVDLAAAPCDVRSDSCDIAELGSWLDRVPTGARRATTRQAGRSQDGSTGMATHFVGGVSASDWGMDVGKENTLCTPGKY